MRALIQNMAYLETRHYFYSAALSVWVSAQDQSGIWTEWNPTQLIIQVPVNYTKKLKWLISSRFGFVFEIFTILLFNFTNPPNLGANISRINSEP